MTTQRNTSIRGDQIKDLTIMAVDLNSTNSAVDNYVPSYDLATGKFTWMAAGGLANIVDDTTPQLGGDLDLNGFNIDFPSVADISDVKDEDDLASDSATMLATQQSIKAYVDTTRTEKTTATMTRYVDYTDGTDDTSHGTGTGTDAWKTIEYAVSQIPKYLAHNVTINVADGIHTDADGINIKGFIGSNILTIEGNTGTPSNCELKASFTNHAFTIENNSSSIIIKGFEIDNDGSADIRGIYVYNNSGYVEINSCIITEFTYSNWGAGVEARHSPNVRVEETNLPSNTYGIVAYHGGIINSYDNSGISSTGLHADAGIIFKAGGTQPTGSQFDETTARNGQVLAFSLPTVDGSSGQYMETDGVGSLTWTSIGIDDFTIKRVSNELKIADRIELNTMLNAFRIAINGSLSQENMADGISDEFEDEAGIDTASSTNEDYDATNDLYSPNIVASSEVDYMEYASDGTAQAAYEISGLGIPDTNLEGWWLLEETSGTRLDSSGNGNDLTDNNTVLYAAGQYGNAADFELANTESLSIVDGSQTGLEQSGAFSIAGWFKFESITGWHYMVSKWTNDGDSSYNFACNSAGALWFSIYDSTNVLRQGYSADAAVTTGVWYHIAAVYDGSYIRIYKNGIELTGGTLPFSFSGSVRGSTSDFRLSGNHGSASLFDGLMDGITYWSKGLSLSEVLGLYNSETFDSYTKLLLHCDGADASTTFTDGTGNHTVTANGDAQVDTAQSKFGGASVYFDGTTDYLSIPDHADWDIGSGDFTIDFWVRRNGTGHLLGQIDSGHTVSNASFNLYIDGSNYVIGRIASGGTWYTVTGTTALSTGTWYHVAFIRNGNDLNLYIDGTVEGGTTDVTGITANNSTYQVGIGRFGEFTSSLYTGWLDEIRISTGIARWTANFTPETSAYGKSLQSYSESTIKQQGSYSLKVSAAITGSLNGTLTRDLSGGSEIDLTDINTIAFDARATRTGTQFELQIHDSGGTTTTKTVNISVTDTWQEVSWDLSGVANADKDDIDSITIKITNADAVNTIYIDNFLTVSVATNMTLFSNANAAEAQADNAKIIIFEEDVDSITINTDLKVYASRDGGTTYTQITLVDNGDYESGKRILSGTVDISGQPAGTSMKYKIETLNNKDLNLHGVAELWDS